MKKRVKGEIDFYKKIGIGVNVYPQIKEQIQKYGIILTGCYHNEIPKFVKDRYLSKKPSF